MRNKIKSISAFLFALSLILSGCKGDTAEAPVETAGNDNNDTPETTGKDEVEETTVAETTEITVPSVTTVPEETTVPEKTTTPETKTTPVETTTVPETTTAAPVVTTTAPVVTTVATTTTPTPTYQKGYENEISRQLFEAQNAERAKVGLPALSWDDNLAAFADIRAKEMCDYGYMKHARPNGDSWNTVCTGKYATDWNTRAENAALLVNPNDTGKIICKKYCNSPGHYANMVHPGMKYVGISTYRASNGELYSCVIFYG